MDILYISSVPSPEEFDRIKTKVKPNILLTTYGMNELGFKFHTLIMDGLRQNGANTVSLVGRSVSRGTHSGLFWKKRVQKEEGVEHRHLSLINFPLLKHLWLGLAFFFHTLGWQIKHRGKERGIIMDASYVSVLPFVLLASLGCKCKKTAIYCDIYDYMADVEDAFENKEVSFVKRVAKKVIKKCYRALDGYVFLTEQMDAVINPAHKPYIVMEGLVDIHMQTRPNELENKAEGKVVMYAGAIRAQYGVKNLVEGFMDYDNPDARLWIFGDGDYKDALKDVHQRDERITFFGAVPLKTVIEKEFEASLMINPRPVDKEFTKYSFPSKNMEYMASGTPVLTTRLPGMPREYEEFVYLISQENAGALAQDLREILCKPREELFAFGQRAKAFVLENKNNVKQGERICHFLSKS